MSFLTSRNGLVLIVFLAIGGYFLWTEHAAHAASVVPYLPWLLLLACPLLHLFMHGGHGHGHGGGVGGRGAPDDSARGTGVPPAGGRDD
jgi:hypothetical protein